jgi:hypothetical protein
MPKPWGRVARAELDVRPGGIISIDIAGGDRPESPDVGASGYYEGTEIAVDRFVAHVIAMK